MLTGYISFDCVRCAGRRLHVKVVLTKRKDDEDTSSTIYNAMDHREPVLDFQKYINDENIVDEVCHLSLAQPSTAWWCRLPSRSYPKLSENVYIWHFYH